MDGDDLEGMHHQIVRGVRRADPPLVTDGELSALAIAPPTRSPPCGSGEHFRTVAGFGRDAQRADAAAAGLARVRRTSDPAATPKFRLAGRALTVDVEEAPFLTGRSEDDGADDVRIRPHAIEFREASSGTVRAIVRGHRHRAGSMTNDVVTISLLVERLDEGAVDRDDRAPSWV